MSGVKETVQELIEDYLNQENFELVDVEYVKEGKNFFLRVYVDKENGIDIEDCSRISEVLSQKLDEADPINDSYFLEVSSPGAERPLKRPKDFKWAVGKYVLVTTYQPIHGLKEFEGDLTSYEEDDHLTVHMNGKSYDIPLDQVAKARLAIKF